MKDIVMTVLEYIDAHYTDGTLEEIGYENVYFTQPCAVSAPLRSALNGRPMDVQGRTAQRCIESRTCCYWSTEGVNSNRLTDHLHILKIRVDEPAFHRV